MLVKHSTMDTCYFHVKKNNKFEMRLSEEKCTEHQGY